MKTLNFNTTNGILEEIQDAANEFLIKRNIGDTTARLRATDQALKIHALEHMKDRFQTAKLQNEKKLALLKEDVL